MNTTIGAFSSALPEDKRDTGPGALLKSEVRTSPRMASYAPLFETGVAFPIHIVLFKTNKKQERDFW